MSQNKASRFKFSFKLGPSEDIKGPSELQINLPNKKSKKEKILKPTKRSTTPNLAKRNSPNESLVPPPKPVKQIKAASSDVRIKKPKTTKNWFLMWTRMDDPNFAPIYIRKWVRLEESENPLPTLAEKPIKQEAKVFACRLDDCDKVFLDSLSLKKHLASHGEKLFDCPFDECGKKFIDKSKLKRHQLVHTGERPYQCEVCGKKFSLDFNLRTHIRTHTGLKPYGCKFEGCTKRFTQSSNLVAHEKTHIKIEEKSENDNPIEKIDKVEKIEKRKVKKAEIYSDGEIAISQTEIKTPIFADIENEMMKSINSLELKQLLKSQFENLKQSIDSTGLGKVLLDLE